MFKKLMNTINVMLCAVFVFQLVGCGTLFYPERKGQSSGRLDPAVVIMDGIGLLFFLVPGVIAYAVDFNNGTIYLPGVLGSSSNADDIQEVQFDPKDNSFARIDEIIKEQTGLTIAWDQSDMQITQLKSTDEMVLRFAQILTVSQNNLIAFNR